MRSRTRSYLSPCLCDSARDFQPLPFFTLRVFVSLREEFWNTDLRKFTLIPNTRKRAPVSVETVCRQSRFLLSDQWKSAEMIVPHPPPDTLDWLPTNDRLCHCLDRLWSARLVELCINDGLPTPEKPTTEGLLFRLFY